MKLVIVGGVAGGASAAARARRLSEDAEITIIERGYDVSFANCGLPYHIGGEIQERSRLNVQTPESLSSLLNIKIHTRTEAIAIDKKNKTLEVRNLETGETTKLPYDKLLLSPGAAPLRPPLSGIDDERILTLRNLQDMDRIKAKASTSNDVLVIGAGFIGLEVAEQMVHLGKNVTLVELVDQVLPQLDKEMTQHVLQELRENGVNVILADGIKSFSADGGQLSAILNSGTTIQTDLALLSIGVKPESKLATDAGLDIGLRGAIVVNEYQQTSDPDIYAAGDAVETADRVVEGRSVLPMGGPANRQGRTAADHIFMPNEALPYPGSIGTAIVRVFDVAAGTTGWTEKRLKESGIDYGTVTITALHHAGYYPGATPLTVKILWDKKDGRLIGGQVFGAEGVDKRLDVLATALQGRMTIEDLVHLELAYAPPFGSARDVLNIAAFTACNIQSGLLKTVRDFELPGQVIDVRPKPIASLKPIEGARNIPMAELRDRLDEIKKDRPVITVCDYGKTSYFAARVLMQNGYDAYSLAGGCRLLEDEVSAPTNTLTLPRTEPTESQKSEPVVLDATGLACPGPIMKVREAVGALPPGKCLEVRASDPGFANDIKAFCSMAGFETPTVTKDKGVVVATMKPKTQNLTQQKEGKPIQSNADATLVVFSQEMDKALAALVIANGAVAMGGKATLFFTFWGLNVLRKTHGKAKGKTFMDKMFGWMLPKGVDALPLSNMNFFGFGTKLMKWRMASKKLPNLPGLLKDARKNGVRMVACSMSMEAMGIKQEELIDGIEIGGVAEFSEASSKSGTSLFI